MCDPVSIGIASLALAGGTAVTSYVSQKNEAARVGQENEKFYAANKQAAIDAAMLNEHELSLRQSEEILAGAAQNSDLTREEQAALSSTVVAASEAGVSGNSLDAVLSDVASKAGRNKVRNAQNTKMRVDQLTRDKESVLVEANNNINTARQTNVRQPSILTPALQIGGAALNTLDQFRDRQARAGQIKYVPMSSQPDPSLSGDLTTDPYRRTG